MSVKVHDVVGLDTLRHRETAQRILSEINKRSNKEMLIIDFSGVSFASRSFWHELKRGIPDRKISFRNMDPEVEEMMHLSSIKPRVNLKEPRSLKKLRLVTA